MVSQCPTFRCYTFTTFIVIDSILPKYFQNTKTEFCNANWNTFLENELLAKCCFSSLNCDFISGLEYLKFLRM